MCTRVVITAAGPRGVQRWNNHLGRPKHFIQIPLDGETLLHRTVRIVRELGIEDVVIAAPEDDPPGFSYETPGAALIRKPMPRRDENVYYRQADRYLPRDLWNTNGRTIFLPGDFYFAHETLRGIINYDPKTWVFYARVTITEWPRKHPDALKRTRMILGFGFPANEHGLVMESIEGLTAMQRDPNNPVGRSLGLDLYRYMCGQPVSLLSKTARKDGATWDDMPPHLWQPPANSPDVDFDDPATYSEFMHHYRADLHN